MAEVGFSVDVNQLMTDVLGSSENRNDLAVVLENGIGRDLKVQWQVDHGAFEKYEGDPDALAAGTDDKPNTLALGVQARGEGSAIFLYITSGPYVWGIYVRTPPNAENWYQYIFYAKSPSPSLQETYEAVQDADKYYANQGPQDWNWRPVHTTPHSKVTIIMTETSPAQLQVQFKPSD